MNDRCSQCGAWCSARARFCGNCGGALVASTRIDPALAFALSQPVGEFCQLSCGAFFRHRWKAYGVLRGGLYYFREEDQICPRCGRAAVGVAAQTDLMIREQRRSNFWLTLLFLFRN